MSAAVAAPGASEHHRLLSRLNREGRFCYAAGPDGDWVLEWHEPCPDLPDGLLPARCTAEGPLAAIVDPADRAQWSDCMARLGTGEAVDATFRLAAPAAGVRWLEVAALPLAGMPGHPPVRLLGSLRDATARKTKELEARRFRAFAESTSDWFWETDADDRFSFVANAPSALPAFASPLGRRRRDVAAADPRVDWQGYEAALRERRAFHDFHYAVRDSDGRLHWVTASGAPRWDETGSFLGYCGSSRDVTERLEARRAAEAAAALQRAVLDALPVHIAVLRADATVLGANERWRQFARECGEHDGVGEAYVEAATRLYRHGPETAAEIGAGLAAVLNGSAPAFARDFASEADGQHREFHLSAAAVPHAAGCAAVVVHTDVTAERRALAEARSWREELRRRQDIVDPILDNMADGVMVVDPAGRFLLVNRALRQILDTEDLPATFQEWLASIAIYDVQSGEPFDPAGTAVARAIAGEACDAVEVLLHNPDPMFGKLISSSARPVVGEDGKLHGAVIVTRDISEARRRQREIAQAQKMEAVGQLTGGIAHDFNNLLTVILGNSDLLLDQLPPGRDDLRRMTETTVQAASRGAALTQRLLTFSRMRELDQRELRPNETIEQLSDLLLRSLGEDVELQVALAPDTAAIWVDPTQFETALLNLAVNARDAMPQGGTLTVRTANVAADALPPGAPQGIAAGPFVRISVADTGHGMTQDVLERIFEPYFTTKPLGRGSGLGLAMVFGFASQHQGFVTVDSAVGQGTTVHIWLPGRTAGNGTAPLAAEVDALPDGERRRILVVEDDRAVRRLLEELLSSLGYDVKSAADADEALDVVGEADGGFDLMLTDLIMPGRMNGWQLAEAVQARWPQMQIGFVSGYSDETIGRRGITIVPARLIRKPFSRAQLAERVAELLSLRRPAGRPGAEAAAPHA